MPRKTARGASSSNTNTSPKRALGSLGGVVVEVDVEAVAVVVVLKRLDVFSGDFCGGGDSSSLWLRWLCWC